MLRRLLRSSVLTLLAANVTVAPRPTLGATAGADGSCSNLYTDAEARGLIRRAKDAVPTGTLRRKDAVLYALGIDSSRLCNRRVVQFNLGYVEAWQMSGGFDIRWAAGVQDRTPLERKDRKTFHVRVAPRETPLSDTRA
jgi:hypothetical protein